MPKQLLLLVEREAKTRRLLKVNLEQAGFAVATARDGEDALRKLELSRPELVLVATDLPKLDGYGFVRRIKDNSEWATLPIIFMIAAESIEDKIRGLELGVEDYLTKPVFVKELVSRVQVLLAKKVSLHLSQSAANTRVAGSLSDLPPIDLLESLEHGQQSGRVRMTWDDRVGEVIFEDGEIIDAHLKRLRGEEVVFRLLCWTEGSFEVEIGDTESDRVIESGTRALIEAGMRHAAEYNRLLEQLPSTDSVLTVDRGALQDRLGKVPEELEGMVTLLDGRRTILDVIDDSPFDDISTLQTMVRLRSEGLLRAVPGVGDIPTIPGPPRTPTPPEQAEARRIYEAPEGEDDAPTLRPPAVAEVTGARVAHVLPAEGDAPAREALTLDPASQRLAADTGITTPRRGSEVGDPGAFGEDDLDDGLDEEPSGEESGEISDEISGEGPISEAPVTPRGHNAPRSAGLPATGPKSVPPPTEDVDAAFQAVLSEIQSEPPPADHRVAPELAEAVVDAAPPPDEDDFERSFQAALAEPSAEEEEEEAAEEEAAEEEAAEEEAAEEVAPSAHEEEPARPEPGQGQGEASNEADHAIEDEPPPSSEPPSSRSVLSSGRRAPSSEPPESGLGRSGISEGFFSRPSIHDEHEHEPIPESEPEEPIYLTPEQVARKRLGMRVVAIVVGALVGLVAYAMFRGRDKDQPLPPRPKPTAAATSTATARPTTTAAMSAAPPATASASAAPAGEGGAGGKKPDAGEGGAPGEAKPSEPTGLGGGEPVPPVDDPLAEAQKMMNMGRYKEGISYAKAAIAKEPKNGNAWFWLATGYEATGKMKEAVEAYGQCAEHGADAQYVGYCKGRAPKK